MIVWGVTPNSELVLFNLFNNSLPLSEVLPIFNIPSSNIIVGTDSSGHGEINSNVQLFSRGISVSNVFPNEANRNLFGHLYGNTFIPPEAEEFSENYVHQMNSNLENISKYGVTVESNDPTLVQQDNLSDFQRAIDAVNNYVDNINLQISEHDYK